MEEEDTGNLSEPARLRTIVSAIAFALRRFASQKGVSRSTVPRGRVSMYLSYRGPLGSREQCRAERSGRVGR